MIDTETGEIKAKRLAHIKAEFREFIGDRTGTRMVIESCRDWSRAYELSEDLVEEVDIGSSTQGKGYCLSQDKDRCNWLSDTGSTANG